MSYLVASVKSGHSLFGIENEIDLPTTVEIVIPSYYSVVTKDYVDTFTRKYDNGLLKLVTLEFFISELLDGKLWAISLLHSNSESVSKKSFIWESLVFNRHEFLSANILNEVPHIEYALKRHTETLDSHYDHALREVLKRCSDGLEKGLKTIGEISLSDIECGNFIRPHATHMPGKPERIGLRFDGKVYELTDSIQSLKHKAKQKQEQLKARSNGFFIPDYNVLTKAIRSAVSILQLIETRNITFPMPDSDIILLNNIRAGKVDINTVGNLIAGLLDKIYENQHALTPQLECRKRWLNFIVANYKQYHDGKLK